MPLRVALPDPARVTRRAAIIGCGTAGPAAAILLAEQGWDITIFEQADEISPVGAGLLLQPAGQRVLARLGVHGFIAERAAHVAQLLGHTTGGRLVLDLRYADLGAGTIGLGVHRAMLIDAMLVRLSETSAELRCGVDIIGIERDGERSRLTTDAGPEGPFDLVVLADGARSRLRAMTGLERRAAPYPWGALWAIVPDTEGVYPDVLRQVYGSTTAFLGFLPSGRVQLDDDPLVSVFWSVRNDRVDALRATDFAAFRSQLEQLAPAAAPILSHLTGWDQLVHARYMDVTLRRPYSPGLVCIGDAAHAMSPQLGQGVTMALRDAEALADALAASPTVDAALADYARRRRAATRFYQLGNRVSTWFFQHDFTPYAWVRDVVFGPLCFTPLVKQQLLHTLAGTKTGVLTHERLQAQLAAPPRIG